MCSRCNGADIIMVAFLPSFVRRAAMAQTSTTHPRVFRASGSILSGCRVVVGRECEAFSFFSFGFFFVLCPHHGGRRRLAWKTRILFFRSWLSIDRTMAGTS